MGGCVWRGWGWKEGGLRRVYMLACVGHVGQYFQRYIKAGYKVVIIGAAFYIRTLIIGLLHRIR